MEREAFFWFWECRDRRSGGAKTGEKSDVDGVLFEIVPAPQEKYIAGKGNGRLCLRVDSVEEALRELKAKGVRVRGAEDKDASVLGTIEDPDENEICLWQYAKNGGC